MVENGMVMVIIDCAHNRKGSIGVVRLRILLLIYFGFALRVEVLHCVFRPRQMECARYALNGSGMLDDLNEV